MNKEQEEDFKYLKEGLIDSIAGCGNGTKEQAIISALHYSIGFLERNHPEVSDLLKFISNIGNEKYKDIYPPKPISDKDFHKIFSNNFDNEST